MLSPPPLVIVAPIVTVLVLVYRLRRILLPVHNLAHLFAGEGLVYVLAAVAAIKGLCYRLSVFHSDSSHLGGDPPVLYITAVTYQCPLYSLYLL